MSSNDHEELDAHTYGSSLDKQSVSEAYPPQTTLDVRSLMTGKQSRAANALSDFIKAHRTISTRSRSAADISELVKTFSVVPRDLPNVKIKPDVQHRQWLRLKSDYGHAYSAFKTSHPTALSTTGDASTTQAQGDAEDV